MAFEYRHTQPGFLTAGAAGAGLLFTARHLLKGRAAVALLSAAIFGGAAVVFSSLTIEIRDGKLRSYFGPGLPAKKVDLHDVESVHVVENPWYFGWGIRVTPEGMLYNVSGLQAVEIKMKNGRRFRLGTDEPEVLRGAILNAITEVHS